MAKSLDQLHGMALARQWHQAVRVSHKAHMRSAGQADDLAKLLGMPTSILSAFVGIAIFATLWQKVDLPDVKIALGVCSILAAILAALQTFLRYNEGAERHRWAAGRYTDITRRLEALLASHADDDPCDAAELESISRQWADVEAAAPRVSQRLYERLDRRMRATNPAPGEP